MSRTAPATICNKGHRVTGDNAAWHVDKRLDAGGRWRCRKCLREAQQKNQESRNRIRRQRRGPRTASRRIMESANMYVAAKHQDRERLLVKRAHHVARDRMRGRKSADLDFEVARARAEILEAVAVMAKDDSKKPWRYLQIKPDARAAWDDFDMALQEAKNSGVDTPPCQDNPGPYADYDEENIPTPDEAFALCADCPLLLAQKCGKFADLERPAWGVWNSSAWRYGEIVSD